MCWNWLRIYKLINYISDISWQSILFMMESSVSGENYRPTASDCQSLSHTIGLTAHCDGQDETELINFSGNKL